MHLCLIFSLPCFFFSSVRGYTVRNTCKMVGLWFKLDLHWSTEIHTSNKVPFKCISWVITPHIWREIINVQLSCSNSETWSQCVLSAFGELILKNDNWHWEALYQFWYAWYSNHFHSLFLVFFWGSIHLQVCELNMHPQLKIRNYGVNLCIQWKTSVMSNEEFKNEKQNPSSENSLT